MQDTQKTNHALIWINVLTGSRLAFALVMVLLTPWAVQERWAIVAGVILVLAIELTDLLDGMLARRQGVVSEFGKMFDPYSDSVSRLMVYWSLAVVGRALVFVPLVMAVRDVTVSYCRILLSRSGRDVSARFTGKLKALVQGVCALMLAAGPLYWGQQAGRWWVHGLSLLVVLVTLASMVDYAQAALRASTAPS